jgi:hypothetical protein
MSAVGDMVVMTEAKGPVAPRPKMSCAKVLQCRSQLEMCCSAAVEEVGSVAPHLQVTLPEARKLSGRPR